MSYVIAIIPARSGSKGLPGKNIKLLAGRPLIAYSIMAARLARNIDRVIVSTDSPRYADIARQFGADVPFLRPVEISGDSSTDYEFIEHFLKWLQQNDECQPEFMVHLRPTTPLREIHYIEAAVELMKKKQQATALRSVHEMPESAYKMFETEGEFLKQVGSASYDLDSANLPRQAYPKTYKANGYVDVLRTSFVTKNRKLHGNRVLAFITDRIIEIDTQEDFEYLEYRVSKDKISVDRLFQEQ